MGDADRAAVRPRRLDRVSTDGDARYAAAGRHSVPDHRRSITMRTAIQTLIVFALLAGPCSQLAHADGGQVRVMRATRRLPTDSLHFAQPTPRRPGRRERARPRRNDRPDHSRRHRSPSNSHRPTNRSRPSAPPPPPPPRRTNSSAPRWSNFPRPVAGTFASNARPRTQSIPSTVAFTMDAAPPLPRWLSVWPWFTWPIRRGAALRHPPHARRPPTYARDRVRT